MTDGSDGSAAKAAEFIYEMGFLKQVKRAGWSLVGISGPETVAEHSFRAALIGFILASEEGADPTRTAVLCLLHDSQETRTGDVASVGRPYVTTADNVDITSDQTTGLPENARKDLVALVKEYEACETHEAKLAHEADKLECIFQAREYQTQRSADTRQWIETCSEGVTSATGSRLLEAAIAIQPNTWWQQFQSTYNQLPRSRQSRTT